MNIHPCESKLSKNQIAKNQKRFETIYFEKLLNQIKSQNLRIYNCINSNLNDFKKLEIPISNMYIHGNVGVGKSVAAVWHALEWARLNYIHGNFKINIELVTVGHFLELLRNGYAENIHHVLFKKYLNCDMLILDDLGSVAINDWGYSSLYDLIDYRYSMLKASIYTANMSLGEMAEKLKDDRIPSRIDHESDVHVYELKGNSRRL